MMLLGTIIAIIGTKALGDESQLGLQVNNAARVRG